MAFFKINFHLKFFFLTWFIYHNISIRTLAKRVRFGRLTNNYQIDRQIFNVLNKELKRQIKKFISTNSETNTTYDWRWKLSEAYWKAAKTLSDVSTTLKRWGKVSVLDVEKSNHLFSVFKPFIDLTNIWNFYLKEKPLVIT